MKTGCRLWLVGLALCGCIHIGRQSEPAVLSGPVRYTVRPAEIERHVVRVQLSLDVGGLERIDLALPLWFGTFQRRAFAAHVSGFHATDGVGRELEWVRKDTRTWTIELAGHHELTVDYNVEAQGSGPGDTRLGPGYLFLAGASSLLYPVGGERLACELRLQQLDVLGGALNVRTPLTVVRDEETGDVEPFAWRAPSYGSLVDCPVVVGSYQPLTTVVLEGSAGEPGVVVRTGVDASIEGEGSERVVVQACLQGLARIVGQGEVAAVEKHIAEVAEAHWRLMHGFPFDLIHLFYEVTEDGPVRVTSYRGLAVIEVPRSKLGNGLEGLRRPTSEALMRQWIPWRIAPASITVPQAPGEARTSLQLDYGREVYTDALWTLTGLVDYCTEVVLLRAARPPGIDEFYAALAGAFERVERASGASAASLAEEGILVWLDGAEAEHRHVDPSVATAKGMILVFFLDLLLRSETRGERSLDTVLRYVVAEIARLGQAFHDRSPVSGGAGEPRDIIDIMEEISGIDLEPFFRDYVHGRVTPPYDRYLGLAGLVLEPRVERRPWSGFRWEELYGGRLFVASVDGTGPAARAKLLVGDEIVLVNGRGGAAAMKEALSGVAIDGNLELRVRRPAGQELTVVVEVAAASERHWRVRGDDGASAEARRVREGLIGGRP